MRVCPAGSTANVVIGRRKRFSTCSISRRSCQLACSETVQRDQDVIGLERRDCVRDDRHDASTGSRAARVRTDRVHVAQDRVEALVGVVPESIHLIGEPGQSSGERRRDDIDLGRGVDDRADGGR